MQILIASNFKKQRQLYSPFSSSRSQKNMSLSKSKGLLMTLSKIKQNNAQLQQTQDKTPGNIHHLNLLSNKKKQSQIPVKVLFREKQTAKVQNIRNHSLPVLDFKKPISVSFRVYQKNNDEIKKQNKNVQSLRTQCNPETGNTPNNNQNKFSNHHLKYISSAPQVRDQNKIIQNPLYKIKSKKVLRFSASKPSIQNYSNLTSRSNLHSNNQKHEKYQIEMVSTPKKKYNKQKNQQPAPMLRNLRQKIIKNILDEGPASVSSKGNFQSQFKRNLEFSIIQGKQSGQISNMNQIDKDSLFFNVNSGIFGDMKRSVTFQKQQQQNEQSSLLSQQKKKQKQRQQFFNLTPRISQQYSMQFYDLTNSPFDRICNNELSHKKQQNYSSSYLTQYNLYSSEQNQISFSTSIEKRLELINKQKEKEQQLQEQKKKQMKQIKEKSLHESEILSQLMISLGNFNKKLSKQLQNQKICELKFYMIRKCSEKLCLARQEKSKLMVGVVMLERNQKLLNQLDSNINNTQQSLQFIPFLQIYHSKNFKFLITQPFQYTLQQIYKMSLIDQKKLRDLIKKFAFTIKKLHQNQHNNGYEIDLKKLKQRMVYCHGIFKIIPVFKKI